MPSKQIVNNLLESLKEARADARMWKAAYEDIESKLTSQQLGEIGRRIMLTRQRDAAIAAANEAVTKPMGVKPDSIYAIEKEIESEATR